MNAVQEILDECFRLGVSFQPETNGKLHLRAQVDLPEDLLCQIRKYKPAILEALKTTPLVWQCPHCQREAEPDGGTFSKDGTGYIQFWRCLSCRAKGSTVFRLQ